MVYEARRTRKRADTNLPDSFSDRDKLSPSDSVAHVGKPAANQCATLGMKLTLMRFTRSIRGVKLVALLLQDESGATAVEYSLILGGIAAAIIVMVYIFGNKVNNLYNNTQSQWP
jgi:Flp pilus assembly pilin Flp